MRLLVILLAIMLGSPTVMAQPRGRGAPAPVDRRETIKKKIRALRAYTLTEELKLDEATAGKLFPVLAKWDDVTDKLLVARADLARQLEGVGAIKDPRAIDKLIDDAVANQKAFWDLEDKRLVELRRILTPAQAARLVVVLPQFERRIQNQLRKAIQNQRTGGRAGGRAGRTNDADFGDDEGGDLSGDPFADPFAGRGRGTRGAPLDPPNPPAPRAPAPRNAPAPSPPGATKPKCDPFSSAHCLE